MTTVAKHVNLLTTPFQKTYFDPLIEPHGCFDSQVSGSSSTVPFVTSGKKGTHLGCIVFEESLDLCLDLVIRCIDPPRQQLKPCNRFACGYGVARVSSFFPEPMIRTRCPQTDLHSMQASRSGHHGTSPNVTRFRGWKKTEHVINDQYGSTFASALFDVPFCVFPIFPSSVLASRKGRASLAVCSRQ